MDYDPQNRSAPPPRYAVESDSEDELGGSQSRPRQIPQITAQPEIPPSIGQNLIVLVGRIGLSWAVSESELSKEGHSRISESGGVFVGSDQQASLAATDPQYLLLAPDSKFYSDPALTIELVRHVFDWLKPKSISVLDSYSPQLYIHTQEEQSEWSTVRFTGKGRPLSERPGLLPLHVPNAVTGLAAAFATEATLKNIPLLLLQLPLLSAPPVSSSTHGVAEDPRSLNPTTLALRAERDLEPETVHLVGSVLNEWHGNAAQIASTPSAGQKSWLAFVMDRSNTKPDVASVDDDESSTTKSSSMYL